MLNDWKQAWREAVDNFRREVAGEEVSGDLRARAMNREFQAAQRALERLDVEIQRTRKEAGEERESEQVCRRREDMARRINDEETVRVAVEFAVRHSERAGVLERKVTVLVEEHTLLARDLESMKVTLAQTIEQVAISPENLRDPREVLEERAKQDRDFGRLEREAKEKAAAERLEELKRRMR
jgi:hypothetical protein